MTETFIKKKIWLDCDPGHDDAMAIILAGHNDNIDLLGVSTVYGNQTVEKTTINALKMLAITNQSHVDVVKGVSKPLLRPLSICPEIHGESGLDTASEGGAAFPEVDTKDTLAEKAIVVMNRVISEQEDGSVTLVATGCLSNVALLFLVYPELISRIKELVLIGGAMGRGNISPVAEFNILIDPEAAKIVFESGVKIVQIPINVTHMCLVTPKIIEKLNTLDSLFGKLMIALLNFFTDTYRTEFNFEHPPLHDPLAIAYVINPDIFEITFERVDIECVSPLCTGQTIVDVWKQTGRAPNVHLAKSIDVDAFWDLMVGAWERANVTSCLNK